MGNTHTSKVVKFASEFVKLDEFMSLKPLICSTLKQTFFWRAWVNSSELVRNHSNSRFQGQVVKCFFQKKKLTQSDMRLGPFGGVFRQKILGHLSSFLQKFPSGSRHPSIASAFNISCDSISVSVKAPLIHPPCLPIIIH